MEQDLVFARREPRQSLLGVDPLGAGLLPPQVLLEGPVNGLEKLLIVHWFGKKIQRTGFHGLRTGRDVRAAHRENNGDLAPLCPQSLLQFQAIQTGHREIEHETPGCTRLVSFQEFARGREKWPPSGRPKEASARALSTRLDRHPPEKPLAPAGSWPFLAEDRQGEMHGRASLLLIGGPHLAAMSGNYGSANR